MKRMIETARDGVKNKAKQATPAKRTFFSGMRAERIKSISAHVVPKGDLFQVLTCIKNQCYLYSVSHEHHLDRRPGVATAAAARTELQGARRGRGGRRARRTDY